MSRVTVALICAMAAILSLTGFYMVIQDAADDTTHASIIISDVILLAGGVATVVFCRYDLKKAVVSCIFTAGFSILVGNYYMALFLDAELPEEIIRMLLANIYMIFSIVMIYYGLSLLAGSTSSSVKAIVCIGVIAGFELVPALYHAYTGEDIVAALIEDKNILIYCAMHASLVLILTRKGMLLETPAKRLKRRTRVLYDEMCTPPKAFIKRNNLHYFLDPGTDGWTHYDEGPIATEKKIVIQRSDLEACLQEWRGDGRRHVSFGVRNKDSYRTSVSTAIEHVYIDGDVQNATYMRIYGREGVFIQINVKDDRDEKKGYIQSFMDMIHHFKNRKNSGQ